MHSLKLSLLAFLLLSSGPAFASRDSGGAPAARVLAQAGEIEYETFDDLVENVIARKKVKVACMGNEAFSAPHCVKYGHEIHTSGACFGDDPNDKVGVPAPCCCGG